MTEQNKERKHVAIIGAGISGLSAAYYLQQAGHSAVIFENGKRIGGAIQTSLKDGYLCEHGPNSLMVNDQRIADLIEAAQLGPEVLVANKAANKRFIVHEGKLQALPSSPLSLLSTKLFSFKAKSRLLKEPFMAKRAADAGSESFADFIRRRFGPEILDKAAGPFVSGIYAGDPNRLSTRHAFPSLFELEQNHGSILKGLIKSKREIKKGKGNPHRLAKREIISFKEGMEALPKGIATLLEDGTLFLETKLGGISFNKKTQRWHIDWKGKNGTIGQGSFSDVILTTPAHKLEDLPLEDEILDAVSQVPHLDYPPVAAMMLGFNRSQVKHPLDGFGMLNALGEKSKMLGALFPSTLFPDRAPQDHVSINVMLGGSRTPEHAKMSESAMKASIMDELRRLLGIEGNPVFSNLVRWEKAIPQMNIGYGSALKQIEQCEKKFPGIHFQGNYRGGISLGDCILSGITLTEKISS
ncbi:protoporphyrinogen oxidase [Rubritalea tangerina]|uniref:Coproporphyrinogen III oxidase n=2 Tax=Rubritalea tangerina TaxID=430798 RepID=A0ABW4Z6R5_9BACT